jgi:hypothetical protein
MSASVRPATLAREMIPRFTTETISETGTVLERYWKQYCKLKRVNPRLPLCVHSAEGKGLTRTHPG